MLVTGISRSGTSYLCHLLHQYSDCVALIDPPGLKRALADEKLRGLPDYVETLRTTIAAGGSVMNKVAGGLPVADTFDNNSHAEYRPAPDSPNFLLVLKHVRSTLARLEAVRAVLPEARLVLCVRDPYQTIASWKRTFPHLRDGDVLANRVAHPDNESLPERDRRELAAAARCDDPAERRARWWAWSARRVLENRDGAVLVDYAHLVRAPWRALREILAGLEPGTPPPQLAPSQPRAHLHLLDARDHEAINRICMPWARKLGIVVADA
jgi:hypothetical protein